MKSLIKILFLVLIPLHLGATSNESVWHYTFVNAPGSRSEMPVIRVGVASVKTSTQKAVVFEIKDPSLDKSAVLNMKLGADGLYNATLLGFELSGENLYFKGFKYARKETKIPCIRIAYTLSEVTIDGTTMTLWKECPVDPRAFKD